MTVEKPGTTRPKSSVETTPSAVNSFPVNAVIDMGTSLTDSERFSAVTTISSNVLFVANVADDSLTDWALAANTATAINASAACPQRRYVLRARPGELVERTLTLSIRIAMVLPPSVCSRFIRDDRFSSRIPI